MDHLKKQSISEIIRGGGGNYKGTYVRGFGLSIPAVAGIVSHFVVHVLSEAQLVFGYTNFSKVEVDPPDEISQDRVIDHSLKETEVENLV